MLRPLFKPRSVAIIGASKGITSTGAVKIGSAALQHELKETAQEGGIRFVGPNTAGIVNVRDNVVASISMACDMNPFRKGDVAFITQSSALGESMLGRGMDDGVGFSHWVSTGNEADLDAADFINYMIEEDSVKVITLFLESIRDSEKFLNVCQKAARARKPIIVYKTGLSKISARAVKSHAGTPAGSNEIFDKVCKQFGLIRVNNVAELFKTALVFSWVGEKLPRGYRVGIISTSSSICGVGADECYLAGLELPELKKKCKQQLRQFISPLGAFRNPIHCKGQIRASKTDYQDTIKCVMKQDYIDGIILLVTMAADPRAIFYGQEISKIGKTSSKPVIVAWTGPLSLASRGYLMLWKNRIPNFLSVREAVKAMKALADYRIFLDRFEAKGKRVNATFYRINLSPKN